MSSLIGKIGTIICVENTVYTKRVGIQFDEHFGGHSCAERGRPGYCRYCNRLDELELLLNEQLNGCVDTLITSQLFILNINSKKIYCNLSKPFTIAVNKNYIVSGYAVDKYFNVLDIVAL